MKSPELAKFQSMLGPKLPTMQILGISSVRPCLIDAHILNIHYTSWKISFWTNLKSLIRKKGAICRGKSYGMNENSTTPIS